MKKVEKQEDKNTSLDSDFGKYGGHLSLREEDLCCHNRTGKISLNTSESEAEKEEDLKGEENDDEEEEETGKDKEENSIENSSGYSDLNFFEITELLDYSSVKKFQKYGFITSKSSENLKDLARKNWSNLEEVDNKSELLKFEKYNDIITSKNYFRDQKYNNSDCRVYASEQDISLLKLEVIPRPEGEKEPPKPKDPSIIQKLKYQPLKSDFKLKNKNFRIVWEIEKRQKQLRKLVILPPLEDYNKDFEESPTDRRRSFADLQKKKVRFSMSKRESDLNFRATLSIKNEASGQTVFYKVDKNRFLKEKTIKLMVDSMYRVDISFKPTQTLARALVRGREVKIVERVHDSTASAYSLHLSTRNVEPSVKGHRDEVTILIQLANGLILQTSLQVKFYKAGDTQHCEWGSTFHCVEYDCEPFNENGVISILKETFR